MGLPWIIMHRIYQLLAMKSGLQAAEGSRFTDMDREQKMLIIIIFYAGTIFMIMDWQTIGIHPIFKSSEAVTTRFLIIFFPGLPIPLFPS